MVPDLDAILACDRAIRRRAAAETIPLPQGLVVRHDGLPDVHHLNTVLLDAAQLGLVDQLVVAQRALRAGTPARGFGAGDGDGLQSMCTLFLSTDVQRLRVAMIDEVGTLRGHRERGLARAVVLAAVAAAGTWGADLIAVPADADDWPQLMYTRLGFAPLGRRVALTLSGRAASGSVSGAV